MPYPYFWLMFETLFFYMTLTFIICYFFRKYCQDPKVVKAMKAEEEAEDKKKAEEEAAAADLEASKDTHADVVIGEPALATPGEREPEETEK